MKVLNLFIILLTIQQVYTYAVTKCNDEPLRDEFKHKRLDCLNGGTCWQIQLNTHTATRVCFCRPGFEGENCQLAARSPELEYLNYCDSNPCSPNSVCHSSEKGYYCECMPGYTGHQCETDLNENTNNECRNATCFNGGSCIDGVNSYECLCKWPYTGRYCETKRTCLSRDVCSRKGECIQDQDNQIKCVCVPGFQGEDCSFRVDVCLSQPCLYDGECVVSRENALDYKCECRDGRLGKNCQHENVCATTMPCKNNSTCVNLVDDESDTSQRVVAYKCECNNKQFTGTNCDIQISGSHYTNEKFKTKLNSLLSLLNTRTTTTTTTTTSTNELNTEANSYNATNGSFVLVVNISPAEFDKRKSEIIKEFEKKFGILMLIKKETNGNEMVYPYKPNNSKTTWTRIYFIIIFACLIKSPHTDTQNSTICLQNNIDDLSDGFQVLNELKKSASLLPNYVSNISYEAYNSNEKRAETSQTLNGPTAILICILVALIVCAILSVNVLLRQNAIKKVKAPIWFPPANDQIAPTKVEYEYHRPETIYEKINTKELKLGTSAPRWSLNKVFDDFTHIFHKPTPKTLGEISPSSSTSSNSTEYTTDDQNPPVKMRKLDLSTAMPIQHANPASPECYPSPPESLPDHSFSSNHHILNPINFKGTSFNITPLMMFIMGRSKAKSNKQFHQTVNINEADIIDTFITNGADLSAKNADGETALHLAARCGMFEITKALLHYGADLNVHDNCGRNVLHTAVSSNEYEIVKLLLNHCAMSSSYNQENSLQDNLVLDEKYDLIDSKTQDELGDTPLIIAARLNHNSLIQLLIEFNASVNATDNEGRSALHWCSKVNNFSGALLLIKSGANVNMQDNDEKTPLSSALNELFTLNVADLLIQFDAFISVEDDIKYNKMKKIMSNMQANSACKPNVNQINVDQIKSDLISRIKQEPGQFVSKAACKPPTSVNMMCAPKETSCNNLKSSKLTGTSIKRKLSETMSSQGDTLKLDAKTSKSKKTVTESPQSSYIPLTPSPPVNQFQRNSFASTSFMYPNHQFYSYPQQQQQQIQQPFAQQEYSFGHHLQSTTGMTCYMNETSNNINTSKFYDYNQQTTNSNSNQTYNLFNSNFNESYAAYF